MKLEEKINQVMNPHKIEQQHYIETDHMLKRPNKQRCHSHNH